MILVGRNLSPFVRRVAITLRLLDLPHEQKLLSTVDDRAAILAINPLGRVPALVLGDGEVLIDSSPILDHIDVVAGERALIPPMGPERRQVQRAVALAVGVMEKAVAAYYEQRRRPADKQHPETLARALDQVQAGLAALDEMIGDQEWLCLGRLTQADVSTVAALGFIRAALPEPLPQRFPRLEALYERCHRLPAFAETAP